MSTRQRGACARSITTRERGVDLLAPEMVDETRFNAGIDVVRADQVDEYNAYLDSLGIGG